MQEGKISNLLEMADRNGIFNLAKALQHLTFFNTIDGKHYKFQEFGKIGVGSGKFLFLFGFRNGFLSLPKIDSTLRFRVFVEDIVLNIRQTLII